MRNYSNLLNTPYKVGKDDCYSLARKYYGQIYDLVLTNYARPTSFWESGLDLISKRFSQEGFESVDVSLSRLEVGDGLIVAIAGSFIANHIAVYVGNNYILHHLWMQKSCEENLSDRWKSRILTVVRHPTVTEKNKQAPLPIFDLSKAHARVN